MSCSIICAEPSCTLDAVMLLLSSLPSGQEYKPQIALCLTHPESFSESHKTAGGWEETLSVLSYGCSRIKPPHHHMRWCVLVHGRVSRLCFTRNSKWNDNYPPPHFVFLKKGIYLSLIHSLSLPLYSLSPLLLSFSQIVGVFYLCIWEHCKRRS